MNQQQRSYALNRISEAEKEKVAEIRREATKPEVKLSDSQKVNLVRAGKVKLLPDAHAYTDLRYAFDFSAHESDAIIVGTADAIVSKVKLAADKARDTVMLDDELKALKAINDFVAVIGKL